jgi:hypothetical protein
MLISFAFRVDMRNRRLVHSPISAIFLTCGKHGLRRNFAILYTLRNCRSSMFALCRILMVIHRIFSLQQARVIGKIQGVTKIQ